MYIPKHGDPDEMKIRTTPTGENIDNALDKLSSNQILAMFFRIHEENCNLDHYEAQLF